MASRCVLAILSVPVAVATLACNESESASCDEDLLAESSGMRVSMLQQKFQSRSVQCVADYGSKVGSPTCCGQAGQVVNTANVCPSDEPICVDFVNGKKWGTCQAVDCLADFGSKVGEPSCCGQLDTIKDEAHICPSGVPICAGYVHGSSWGKCKEVECYADYGSQNGDPACCGQSTTVSDTRRVCPQHKPVCNGFIMDQSWGKCEVVACFANHGSVVGDPACCGQIGGVDDMQHVCPEYSPICTGYVYGKTFGTCHARFSVKTQFQLMSAQGECLSRGTSCDETDDVLLSMPNTDGAPVMSKCDPLNKCQQWWYDFSVGGSVNIGSGRGECLGVQGDAVKTQPCEYTVEERFDVHDEAAFGLLKSVSAGKCLVTDDKGGVSLATCSDDSTSATPPKKMAWKLYEFAL